MLAPDERRNLTRQSLLAAGFGLLSALLGFAQFELPGLQGVYSDMREIPLLIALFYLRSIWWAIPLALITSFSTFFNDSYFNSTLIMHTVALAVVWSGFQRLNAKRYPMYFDLLGWVGLALVYYFGLIFPVMLLVDQYFNGRDVLNFAAYQALFEGSVFEIPLTIVVTTLFLVQHRSRQDLRRLNATLEQTVAQRTEELLATNRKLEDTNEELRILNEGLEELVRDRTRKINSQIIKLKAYAHSNSHEVRGPLARLLGLINLVNMESETSRKLEIVGRLEEAALDLDSIVKKVNVLLQDDDLGRS